MDYILAKRKQLTTIEVKSQPGTAKISGMASFCKQFPVNKQLIVGGQGIALEDFLTHPAAHWLGSYQANISLARNGDIM